eukprot:TRINITY_DN51433_c0_g1_i1.p1 TRINITY_DN51433_c0_g1~~TRINITY_DN51433_c0_g1_i1.p1  ORF type:complete len:318 (+),score=98.55 TRINITY_DN51433_c0_g1_i1:85-1038(+)
MSAPPTHLPAWAEFVVSGVAAMGAITCTNPVDVVKTRLQLQGDAALAGSRAAGAPPAVLYRGVGHALWKIGHDEGLRGLQRGLSAAWLLQFSNVGTRFGGYAVVKRVLGIQPGGAASYLALLASGGASGALAGAVSCPFFLLKTRLQAHSCLGSEAAVGFQRDAGSLAGAVREVLREGGVLGFWRGAAAFIPRVAAASSVQLSTYDVVKARVIDRLQWRDGLPVHVAASWITGIAVVLAMQPFDFASTRLMNQPSAQGGGGALYSGLFDCLAKTVRAEGPRSVYRGTLANYLRFGPYCILVFVFGEQLKLKASALLL